MPTIFELNEMYLQQGAIGGFANLNIPFTNYWSSTETDNYDAWFQSFDSGSQVNVYKNYNYYVRAVRAF